MEHAKVIEANYIPRKPSALFLVILNALIFLCLLLPGLNPVGWIHAIPATLVFVAISGIWHGAWLFLNRRLHLHNVIRSAGFVLPVLCLALFPYLGIEPDRPVNKQKPASSESGRFLALVTAESDGWNVEILDGDGLTLLDEKTEFVPHLNVYWIGGLRINFGFTIVTMVGSIAGIKLEATGNVSTGAMAKPRRPNKT